ncbi:MAG: apolipoprotein N-acyltransferase [Actinomycetota bacterium]
MISRPRLLAVPAGLLIAAGLPPWGWWPLTLFGIALWFELIAGRAGRRRFSISFVVGLAWAIPATLWMFDLTAAGWPVAVVIFSLGAGVVGLATPPDGFLVRSFAFTAALVIVELLRWNYPFGGTPIASYAMVGVSTPFWVTARTFGSPGLTIVVAWAGLAVGQAVQRRRDAAIAVGAVLVLVIGGALGSFRVDTVDTLEVAVVQGGGPQNTRADVCTTRAVFERHMAASQTIDRDVDLVVWPEDVVHPAAEGRITPARCDDELLFFSEASERLTDLAADLDAVVVSGWFERTDDNLANANYSIAQSPDGTITDRYDKVRLVPFGEFVPLRGFIEQFSDELPGVDVRPGTGPAILETDVGTLGISISWEVFFDHRARDAIGNGGQVLLNPTNGSSYWLTIVQSQQIASSRLRAVETDRFVLQAAPTGFSGVIAPDGDVLQRTGVSEQKVLYDTIELRDGRTLSVQFGAWPMIVYGLVALAVVWGRRRFSDPDASDLDPQGDGPVVDELDGHVGAKPTGGDDGAGGA